MAFGWTPGGPVRSTRGKMGLIAQNPGGRNRVAAASSPAWASPFRRSRSGLHLGQRGRDLVLRQRQAAQPLAGDVADGVADRGRGRALRRLAGAEERLPGPLHYLDVDRVGDI